MSPKMIEVGDRMGRGADLGIGACLAAASTPELTPSHLALEAQKLTFRFGFTPELARFVANPKTREIERTLEVALEEGGR